MSMGDSHKLLVMLITIQKHKPMDGLRPGGYFAPQPLHRHIKKVYGPLPLSPHILLATPYQPLPSHLFSITRTRPRPRRHHTITCLRSSTASTSLNERSTSRKPIPPPLTINTTMVKIPAYPTPVDSVLTGMSDEYLSSGPITDTADGKLSWSKELSGMPSPASSQRSRFSRRQSLRLRRKRWYQQYGVTLSSAVEEGPGSRMHHTLSGISMSSTASSATVVSQLGFPREVSYSPYSPITPMEKPMTRISRLINSKPKPPHPPRLPLDVLLDQLGIPKTNPAQRPCIQGPKVLVRENSATGARRHTLRTMSSVDTLLHSPTTVNKAASSKSPSQPPKSHDGRRNSEYLYDNNFGNLFRSSNVKRRSFHKSWKLSRLSLPGSPGKVHRVLRTLTRRLSRHVKVWSGA